MYHESNTGWSGWGDAGWRDCKGPVETAWGDGCGCINSLDCGDFSYACSQVFSHVRLCYSMDCSPPGSSVHGVFQPEFWNGLPFPLPGDLPDPGMELVFLALQANSLLLSHRGSLFIDARIYKNVYFKCVLFTVCQLHLLWWLISWSLGWTMMTNSLIKHQSSYFCEGVFSFLDMINI